MARWKKLGGETTVMAAVQTLRGGCGRGSNETAVAAARRKRQHGGDDTADWRIIVLGIVVV